VDALQETGQLDNTLLMLISDNGASAEGGPLGSVSIDLRHAAGYEESLDEGLAALDRLGDETTNPHYLIGWAQAGNTPLKWYKTDVHSGGVRDPLIVHWPARIRDGGLLRQQYHHVVDVTPTILELLGVEAPTTVKGVPQLPIHGTSFAYTLDDPSARTRKHIQYYEMLGDRAIWRDGWKAVTRHQPGTDFDADRWELYHLDSDYAERHDLAAQQPDRLRALIDLWWAEAGRYDALPLDDRGANRTITHGWRDPRTTFTYRPGIARVERWNVPNVANRSYTIEADVEIPRGGAEGVLLAAGSRFGGYALFVKDGHLVHEYNAGHSRYVIRSERPIAIGRHAISFDFSRTGRQAGHGTLSVDGEVVGTGELPRTWPVNPARAGLHCGRDGGTPVSDAYSCPFAFTGTLHDVTVTLGDDREVDRAAERRAALAED
jgi:arylsulfatase